MTIRPANADDLPAIHAIQQACPEAAQWDPAEYFEHDIRLAVCDGRVAGFVVTRTVVEGEHEILNVAVAPEFRRRGVATALISERVLPLRGEFFLEVRESNEAARNLYKSLGFQEVGTRLDYYERPPEAAVVMKFHSC